MGCLAPASFTYAAPGVSPCALLRTTGQLVAPTLTRRRTFTGVGRYPDTLRAVTAELNAEGTDYLLSPRGAPACPPLLSTLEALLRASPVPLTRRELLARWPDSPPRPDSLWRALARSVERGLFVVRGTGTRTEPFRYGLASPGQPPDLPA